MTANLNVPRIDAGALLDDDDFERIHQQTFGPARHARSSVAPAPVPAPPEGPCTGVCDQGRACNCAPAPAEAGTEVGAEPTTPRERQLADVGAGVFGWGVGLALAVLAAVAIVAVHFARS